MRTPITQESEEHYAKAMLLGWEYDPRCAWFRERLGPAKNMGCALYNYYDVYSMQLVLAERSEIDEPLPKAMDDAHATALIPPSLPKWGYAC